MERKKQVEEINLLRELLQGITIDKVLYTSDGEVVDVFKVLVLENEKVANYLANILFAYGYRRAVDVVKEVLDEIENMTEIHEYHDVEVGDYQERFVELSIEDIEDLRRKYEIEGDKL